MARQKMPPDKRAAQFLPFKAVVGLDEAIAAKEKIIDKMGAHIFYHQDDKFPIGYSIKEVKEYFKKEVENENTN